ncbi:uncharacterized protein LOC142166395 isoform X4 [Nicotiana tabacum]|uniref:Uncharacterized protein LOC142166395 isoform X4 n=1 Tax=Nicotiana tabacum TaxID=4097 RepID=A0AC58S9K8_TOBAC
MCSFYHEPWRSWSEVPCHIRDRMFTEFRIKCAWSHDLEAEVWTVFFKKCSDRFFDLLRTARENNVRPTWILDDLWVNLLEYWKSLEFEKKSRQGREARMSEKGSSMHTGGSISMETHRRRLAKGRPVTHDEVFEETHMKKLKDGTKITWVETRAETTHVGQSNQPKRSSWTCGLRQLVECIRGEPTALDQSLVSIILLLNCVVLILLHIARLMWMSLSN